MAEARPSRVVSCEEDERSPVPALRTVLREFRRRARLTQEELADRAGVSVRTIRNLEGGRAGRPRHTSVRLLAAALGLSAREREQLESAYDDFDAAKASVRPVREATVPAQLPPDIASFSGRTEELDLLDAVMGTGGDEPATPVLVSLSGTAGVGKTALAVHWGQRVAHRFPDGQLYANLHGFGPDESVVKPADAVGGFLEALNVPPERIPADLPSRAGLYRSLLAGRRVLVVLDNARDTEQVRDLLPGAPTTVTVVTSRDRLSGLVAGQGAHPLILDSLTFLGARELLAARIGEERIAADPQAAEDVITACGGLPLALAIVAVRALTHPSFPLAVLAKELDQSSSSLDSLTGNDAATDVRAVFSWSYRALGAQSAQLFRLLGLHPGPEIGVPAAASLIGLPVTRVRPLLAELAHAHLIIEHEPNRYSLHDLLRVYAAELSRTVDSVASRRTAAHRMLDHYLRTAHTAMLLLEPLRDPIELVSPAPEVTPEQPADTDQALAWFNAEYRVLLAVFDYAARNGFDAHTWQLAWTMGDFFNRQAREQDWIHTQRKALDAARRLGDPTARAHAHRGLGRAYVILRANRPGPKHREAAQHLQRALELFRELKDTVGQAHVLRDLAWLLQTRGDSRGAYDHTRQAVDLFRRAGHHAGLARALNALGWSMVLTGDYQEAVDHCQEALTLLPANDLLGRAGTFDTLGYAYHHLGDDEQAIAWYRHALGQFSRAHATYYQTLVFAHLGEAHHAQQDYATARDAWELAAAKLDQLDHPDAAHARAQVQRISTIYANAELKCGCLKLK